jgi:hypothetical protein
MRCPDCNNPMDVPTWHRCNDCQENRERKRARERYLKQKLARSASFGPVKQLLGVLESKS